MTPAELRIRCRVAESCLPDAEYRRRLTALHDDMLTIIEAAHTPECEHDWKYVGSKRQIAFQCSKCGEYSFEAPVQEGWDD